MSKEQLARAEATLKARLPQGDAEARALIDAVSKMVIRDKLVPPKKTHFFSSGSGVLLLNYEGDEANYTIHRHALGQLASKVGLPMIYANALQKTSEDGESWRPQLLAYNLNELFHKSPFKESRTDLGVRFLHRLVGQELRGFLSRRYNRSLASAPLLRAFGEACENVGAKAVEATSTDVRVALKCLLPTVFEAYPGEYLCLGVEWSNSDFGAGKLSVCQTIWRVLAGTSSVLDESVSKVHIGSIIEETDIDLSEDTMRAEVSAQQKVVRDAVKKLLEEKMIDRMLTAVRAAHELEIPWSRLKGQLINVLSKADVDWMRNLLDGTTSIVDLPSVNISESDDGKSPNAWWVSSCLSTLASRSDDPDRRLELQREAGRFLAGGLRGAKG